jgi:DNA-binding MarR family transcriptional regulator
MTLNTLSLLTRPSPFCDASDMATLLLRDSAMADDMTSYAALAAFHTQLQRLVDSTDQRTREAGLQRTKLRMLLAIRRQPAAATIGALATALNIDRTTVVEIVDELVRQGFVTRQRDPHDRRRFLISLTATGHEWIGPVVEGELRELATAGPELLRTLRAVIAHASAHVARPCTETRLDVSDFVWRGSGVAAI